MKKPQYLVSPAHARCIDSREEVQRLLAAGWLLAQPKAKTKAASRLRTLRDNRRAEGWLSLWLWLPPEDVALVKAAKRRGESYADLLTRLVKESSMV